MFQREIQTSILIDASPETVWTILMDFESYPTWNPFIQKATGQRKVESQLTVEIHPPGASAQTFSPHVKVVKKNEEFVWLGMLGFKGLFDGRHRFGLERVGSNQTRFHHGEQFNGILVPLLLMIAGKATKQGFESMNEAIKKRAENL